MALGDLFGFLGQHPFISATILVALVFDFTNGFHDAANAIATVVATKVLTPGRALLMAAVFNFVGPFAFSLNVAATVGTGIILTSTMDAAIVPSVIFAAVAGAIIWNLITWYVGLPSSSSHSLVGGLIGAALAAVGPAGIAMPTWNEWLLIGKYAVWGALGGLALAALAWAYSRARLPRGVLAPTGAIGAALLGVLFVNTHALPPIADWKHLLEYGLTLLTMLFLGIIIGLVFWAASQQRMSMRLLPGFALFGACVALVVGVLLAGAPAGTTNVLVKPFAAAPLKLGGITKTVLFMIVSPILGFFAGFLTMSAISWVALKAEPGKVSAGSKRAQLFSSAFYALTHGTNDAQKTMGIIAALLVATGAVAGGKAFTVPTWVILASATAMGLGTLFGGWRIIRTMASRITHLTPIQGFAAETGGGVVLVGMAQAGIPVSTTHAITASIMGVGATKRTSAVSWGMGRRIVGAWILTIPAAAIVGFASYFLLRALGA